MLIDLVLKGTITPVAPVNITKPDVDKSIKGTPMMSVPHVAGGIDLPYIPGETFRGLLRERAGDLVAKASKQPMNMEIYNILYKGGIKGKAKETAEDLLKAKAWRESNPALGLFGTSAPRWLGGSLSVGAAVPGSEEDCAITLSNGVRLDDFKRKPELLASMSPEAVTGYLRYANLAKESSQLRTEIEDLKREAKRLRNPKDGEKDPAADTRIKEINQLIAEKDARMNAIRDTGDYENTIGRPLDNRRAIAPRSRLNQRLEISAGTEAEIGLFLTMLQSLERNCRIGGMRGIGYGYFTAEWSILIADAEVGKRETAGTLSVGPDESALQSSHPLVKRSLKAWQDRVKDPQSLWIRLEDDE